MVVQGGKIKRKFVDLGAPLRKNSSKGKKWKEKEKEASRFSPGSRIFRGRLEHWKPKPSSAAQASPRSPCMPFSWFNESWKGSYSFKNLPSPTSPLQPSPETLISDKKGSKVEKTHGLTKKARKPQISSFSSVFGKHSQLVCVYWI